MEDTLRAKQLRQWRQTSCSLNPCCNGRYSQRVPQSSIRKIKGVLILVVMEDTLRVTVEEFKAEMNWVLILVVMEDTLRVKNEQDAPKLDMS